MQGVEALLPQGALEFHKQFRIAGEKPGFEECSLDRNILFGLGEAFFDGPYAVADPRPMSPETADQSLLADALECCIGPGR